MLASKTLIPFSAPEVFLHIFFFFPEGDLSCPFPQEMRACVRACV